MPYLMCLVVGAAVWTMLLRRRREGAGVVSRKKKDPKNQKEPTER